MKPPFMPILVLFAFLVNSLGPLPLAQADGLFLPQPGTMVSLSPSFNPPILKGLKVHPDNPFKFDFILDQGDSARHAERSEGSHQEQLKIESTKLIKYFLASLTIPEKDLWVNLSPYEKNRIVPQSFGQTEMGRDLLAEDYMLKQITASLIYPEGETGKKFWKRIYAEASKKFGTTNIPVNTFNKVWIVPEKAIVYENAKAGTAYVVEAKLKVMLEEDYLSTQIHQRQPGDMFKSEQQRTCPHARCQANLALNPKAPQGNPQTASPEVKNILKEIVLPELTKEVNQGQNFAQLRQVYNSLILATWYKKKIKDSILEQVYANKNKVAGILSSPNALVGDPQHIYQQYLKAFKKGVYNYIKEENDPVTQQPVPRKYFSGGADLDMLEATHLGFAALKITSNAANLDLSAQGKNLAMISAVLKSSPFVRLVQSFIMPPNNLHSEDPIMLPLGADVVTSGRFRLTRYEQFRVQQENNGLKAQSSLGWVHESTSYNDLNYIFNMMNRIKELNAQRKDTNQPIVIVDWGCGTALALRGLFNALQQARIINVRLYGFADEYSPYWRKAKGGIHFILDTPEHLKDHLEEYKGHVGLIYSVMGLEHLFHQGGDAWGKHLKDLKELLDPHVGKLLIANIEQSALFKSGTLFTVKTHAPLSFMDETIYPTEWTPVLDSAMIVGFPMNSAETRQAKEALRAFTTQANELYAQRNGPFTIQQYVPLTYRKRGLEHPVPSDIHGGEALWSLVADLINSPAFHEHFQFPDIEKTEGYKNRLGDLFYAHGWITEQELQELKKHTQGLDDLLAPYRKVAGFDRRGMQNIAEDNLRFFHTGQPDLYPLDADAFYTQYYRQTQYINDLLIKVLGQMTDEALPSTYGKPQDLDHGFTLHPLEQGFYIDAEQGFHFKFQGEGDAVSVIDFEGKNMSQTFEEHPELLIQVFQWAVEHEAVISDHVWKAMAKRTAASSETTMPMRRAFFEFLKNPGKISLRLLQMYKIGLLGKFFPEFDELKYHFEVPSHRFSVPVHTLYLFNFLENFPEEMQGYGIHEATLKKPISTFSRVREGTI